MWFRRNFTHNKSVDHTDLSTSDEPASTHFSDHDLVKPFILLDLNPQAHDPTTVLTTIPARQPSTAAVTTVDIYTQ